MNPVSRASDYRLSFVAPLAVALVVMAGAPPARAEAAPVSTPVASALEPLAPTTYVARQDAVPIRSEPGFVYREMSRLPLGGKVEVDARQGEWLRVRGGGWVFQGHVWTEAEAAAAPPPTTKLVVTKEGARVRAAASTDAAVVDTLKADAVVDGVSQSGGWWQLASGGFISAALVQPRAVTPLSSAAAQASTPDRPLPWVVASSSANIRSGRGSEFGVTRRVVRGDIVTVTSVVDGWAAVDGGWIRQDLLQPPAAPRSPAVKAASATEPGRLQKRWSLMDLNGTVFEVYELAGSGLEDGIRNELRRTGVLEADWTLLGITIGVPKDSPYTFEYSPDANAVHVKDVRGSVYGNVFAKGPLERMPSHIREALDARSINPGESFSGVLLFRPTLKVSEIAAVMFDLDGRSHRLIPAR